MAELNLPTLQSWMMTACTAAGGITEGQRISRARYGLTACAVVKATSRLSAEDRLDIYARGYLGGWCLSRGGRSAWCWAAGE